jgi:hypothetical protein
MTATGISASAAHLITGYGMVAGARADLMPFGAERNAMAAAAARCHSFAQAIERGFEFTDERFAEIAAEIDAEMDKAGDLRLPSRSAEWIAVRSLRCECSSR